MTAENETRGRSNRRKGQAWMQRCVQALRGAGWPHAEVIPSHGRSDIGGCGDIAVECKDEQGWSQLGPAAIQAERDARFRDLPTFVVWRKRHGWGDPMDGWCVQPARQFWADRKELERLEAVELEYARFSARLAAAQETREATA